MREWGVIEAIKEEARERQAASQAKPGEKIGSKSRQKVVVPGTPPNDGKSRDAIGALLGVSGSTVDRMDTILDSGNEEVINEVASGKTSIKAAAKKIRHTTVVNLVPPAPVASPEAQQAVKQQKSPASKIFKDL
jgi:hypothetical protein